MSFDIDENGNKVFNEPIEHEGQIQEYAVHFKGLIYVEAKSKEEAQILAEENPDLFEYIDKWAVE
jgi:hypothetical protein